MLSLTGRTVTQYSNSTRMWTRTERALAQQTYLTQSVFCRSAPASNSAMFTRALHSPCFLH